jgi:hypothetical protein
MIAVKIVEFLEALSAMSRVKVAFYDNGQVRVMSQYAPTQRLLSSPHCRMSPMTAGMTMGQYGCSSLRRAREDSRNCRS